MEIAATTMADVSEKSGQWWKAVTLTVEAAYTRWLGATHMERLTIQPEGMDALCQDEWARINARACSMLVSAMGPELKADMIAQRITQFAPALVFRLYTWYQPGGSAERQEILRRLQAPHENVNVDVMEAVLNEVRSWPRWLARCHSIGMVPPDPSVMSKGLQALTTKQISGSTDAAFRTSMLRSTLRLDCQPTLEQVKGYQRHLQAELEILVGSQTGGSSTPALRTVEPTPTTTSPKNQKTKERSQEMCRYFSRPTGCKRGDKCVCSHSMQGMDKEQRARKCLKCGSESHRARECTVGKQQPKAGAPGGGPSQKLNDKTGPATGTPSMSVVSTATPTGSSTTTTSTGSAATVQGVPWTLESLVQVAQQVIQNQAPQEGDSSPEKTKADLRVITVQDIRISSLDHSSTALLDSGATHSLRSAYSEEEWLGAEEVQVRLAGGGSLRMRLSSGGSLLMPPRNSGTTSSTIKNQGNQTIVPLGELVKVLGYSLEWSQRGCFLKDSEGNIRSLGLSNGCPHLKEAEALALIARLEDRKMEILENAITITEDTFDTSMAMMEVPWRDHLAKYVGKGDMQAGLRAVRDAPFLGELPGECVDGLVQDNINSDGWAILKEIEFLSRPQRRKLWSARRWVIHLYAGSPGHHEIFYLDDGGTVVLELDLHRCKAHDLLRNSTWRLVMWAAMSGRVEAVVGGPPGRGGLYREVDAKGESNVKNIKLVTRMLWLYAVAEAGRSLNAKGLERGRPVGFVIEHPAKTKESDSPSVETRRGSLWGSSLWKEFSLEYGMTMVGLDQRAMGSPTTNRTTLGTNVYYLMGLDGLAPENSVEEPSTTTPSSSEWSPGLVRAIVMAMRFWIRHPQQAPVLAAFTPEQWKKHVDGNHADYRRDCLTCVMSRGTGRRHGKVRHPEMFSLTVDLAGPVKPGLDVTSKGTMGRGLKYMMVARYVLPKEYVRSYTTVDPPEDHGMDTEMPTEQVDMVEGRVNKELSEPSRLPPQDEGGNLAQDISIVMNEELSEPSRLPPQDEGGNLAQDISVVMNKELSEPSRLPPQDEGDPFVIVEDEPGEQGRLSEDAPGEQGREL